MKVEIKRQFKKPINKNPTWLGNLKKRLQLKKNKIHFLANNNLSLIESNNIRSPSKLIIPKELSQKQENGLLYANIAKLR